MGGVIVVHRQKVITLDVKKTRKKEIPLMMAFMSAMQCLSFDFFYPRPPSGLLNVIEAIHKEVKYFLEEHSDLGAFLFYSLSF